MQVDATHGDGDDLAARGFERSACGLEVGVFPRAREETRPKLEPTDVKRVRHSTASNEMHDLDAIAIGELGDRMPRPRHDFLVPLDRDELVPEPERREKPGHGRSSLDLFLFPIDDQLHARERRSRVHAPQATRYRGRSPRSVISSAR